MQPRAARLGRGHVAARRQRVLALTVLLLVGGCATTAGFSRQMDTWLGSDINETMIRWGPPSSTYAMPNGSIQYTWLYVGNTVVTTSYNHYLNMVQAGAVTYWCQVTMSTEASGRIVAWNARGNGCRAR